MMVVTTVPLLPRLRRHSLAPLHPILLRHPLATFQVFLLSRPPHQCQPKPHQLEFSLSTQNRNFLLYLDTVRVTVTMMTNVVKGFTASKETRMIQFQAVSEAIKTTAGLIIAST